MAEDDSGGSSFECRLIGGKGRGGGNITGTIGTSVAGAGAPAKPKPAMMEARKEERKEAAEEEEDNDMGFDLFCDDDCDDYYERCFAIGNDRGGVSFPVLASSASSAKQEFKAEEPEESDEDMGAGLFGNIQGRLGDRAEVKQDGEGTSSRDRRDVQGGGARFMSTRDDRGARMADSRDGFSDYKDSRAGGRSGSAGMEEGRDGGARGGRGGSSGGRGGGRGAGVATGGRGGRGASVTTGSREGGRGASVATGGGRGGAATAAPQRDGVERAKNRDKEREKETEVQKDDAEYMDEVSQPFSVQHHIHVDFNSSVGFQVSLSSPPLLLSLHHLSISSPLSLSDSLLIFLKGLPAEWNTMLKSSGISKQVGTTNTRHTYYVTHTTTFN